MSQKYILTVTLNPTVDRFILIPGFQIGGVYYRSGDIEAAGGKGVNVSRALKNLGEKTLATGILGGCSGKVTILRLLRKERINQDFYRFGGYSRTSLNIYNPVNHQMTRLLEDGPKVKPVQVKGFIEKYKYYLERSRCVVLSGRNGNGVKDSIYAELIRLAGKDGVPAVLDSSGRAFELGVKAKPWMVKPNVQEAEEFLKKKLRTKKDFVEAIQKYHSLGVGLVVLSCDKKGAFASDGQTLAYAQPPKVKVLCDVGCGDALVGAFLTEFLKNKDLGRALKVGVSIGTASALQAPPAIFSRRDLDEISEKVQLKISPFPSK